MEVPWDEALDAVANEVARVRTEYGNEAIYGGSYGWASAGRFHHAQSQLHRFLDLAGGCTRRSNTYSTGTSEVLLPHVVGSAYEVLHRASSWSTIVEHTELLVAFGGVPAKNVSVSRAGHPPHVAGRPRGGSAPRSRHRAREPAARRPPAEHRGHVVSRCALAPTSRLMLGLAHTLVADGLVDRRSSTATASATRRWRRTCSARRTAS